MDAVLVYVTAANRDEALRIGETVVGERLAACANILDGMVSVYRWQGELRRDAETVVILKSRASLLDRLTAAVKRVHSYEVPCIVAVSVAGGSAAYLDWIAAETEGA